ncbi:uncharacterized protein LOC144158987 [Haemaphysalis longicornis]
MYWPSCLRGYRRTGYVDAPRLLLLGILLVKGSLAGKCDLDQREGIIRASELGRATSHFMKNCRWAFRCLSSRPDMTIIYEFLDHACAAVLNCSRRTNDEDPVRIMECTKPLIYNETYKIPRSEVECLEKAGDCAIKEVRSVNGVILLIGYLKKLLG